MSEKQCTAVDIELSQNPIINDVGRMPQDILQRMRCVLQFVSQAVGADVVESDEARMGAYLTLRSCEEAAKQVEAMLDEKDGKRVAEPLEEVDA